MFCLRTLREMKLLRYFNHENIISILDIQKPLNYDHFTEVYLIQVSSVMAAISCVMTFDSQVGTDGNRYAPRHPHAGVVR